ncbi:hypothetical protein FOZ61_005963 [Perkinsus olseni]|uniref:Uncharacterized protein n=1 Tax=Perkinsus olseni TaxID=32597 RepID=A0A7J6MC08_PEROL|nr:hypothetical protein FOZ61_005963 [Perkinsus olseni]
MRRLRRLPASGAHNLLLHIARCRGPRGPDLVTVAPLCRAVLMKIVWHERDDPHWLRTAAGACGLAVSRVGVDWNAHIPVRYRPAVLKDISRAVQSVAEAIGPTTDGASIGYVCEAAKILGLESRQFTNVVMDAVADTSDEGRRFGPLPLVQIVSFLADYVSADPSRSLPEGLDKIVEWRLSCHWPEVSGQNVAQLLGSMECLGWLSDKFIINCAQRISLTLHASLRPQDTFKILPIFLRRADLQDTTVISAIQALVGRTILFSKLDVGSDDVMALVEVWRDATRSGHGPLFPSGFRPWLRNQLAVRGEEAVNRHSVMALLEAMHTGRPQARDALSLEISGVLPTAADQATLLRYLHYLSFYFTQGISEVAIGQPSDSSDVVAASSTPGSFDWTNALLKAASPGDLASLAVALGVCARIGRVDSAVAVLYRVRGSEKTAMVPSGSPREWALWAGIYDSVARLRLKSLCPERLELASPESLSEATRALLVHACSNLDIEIDPLGILLGPGGAFQWDALSAEGMAQLLVTLWEYLDPTTVVVGASDDIAPQGETESPRQSLCILISAGLEALVSRLEGLPAGTDLPASLPLLTAMARTALRSNFEARDTIQLPLRVVEVLDNVSECYSASESSSFSLKSSSGCRTEVYSTLKRVVSTDECLPFKESLVTSVRQRQRLRVGDKSRLVLQKRVGGDGPEVPVASDGLVEAFSYSEISESGRRSDRSMTIARRVDSGLCGIPIDLLVFQETVLEGRGVVPFFVGGGVRFLREPGAVETGEDVTEKLREKFRAAAGRVEARHVDNEPCRGGDQLQSMFVK